MILRDGNQLFEFDERPELRSTAAKAPSNATEVPFKSHEDALNWLKHRGTADSDLVVLFRDLVGRHSDISRWTNDQVVDRLAVLLYLGRVRVTVREQRARSGVPSETAAPAAPPFPLADRTSSSTSVSPPPPANDPPTFSPGIDGSAQAAALVAAAADGKPFCPE